MGHVTTPKFELQAEKKDNRMLILGVNSINEAKKEIKGLLECPNLSPKLTGNFFLWGNSKTGKNIIEQKHCHFLIFDKNKFIPGYIE